MKFPRFVVFSLLIGLVPVSMHGAGTDADRGLPENLGGGLRKLVAWHQAQSPALSPAVRRALLEKTFPQSTVAWQLNADTAGAVVDVTLDGTATSEAVAAKLTTLGAQVLARYDARHGAGDILSIRLPFDSAAGAARLPGVYAVSLVRRPHRHVGKATTQGVTALDVTAAVSAAYDGTGITVGVLSDSFDTSTTDAQGDALADHAAQDILSGDLPGPGNPLGHLTPVTVLADGAPTDTDEGRAMLQIVHDLAPGAALVFAADGGTPETLASNILALRTNTAAPCDIIVDDLAFAEEPFFSDGPAAQAADDAVHSTDLAGHPVLFYSAAGDQGASGSYDGTFNPVADATARTGTVAGNLKLDQVPGDLTGSGFHNFSTVSGQVSLSQRVTVEGDNVELDFQWDDPWLPGLISTDYSLLVFDAEGNYLADLSGVDDGIKLARAIQIVDLPLGASRANAIYQLAIARRATGLQQATHLRYLVTTQGALRVAGFTNSQVPSIYGHAAANGADAVAAYAYNALQFPEGTSSLGPVTIYFDNLGNRLSTPDVRDQPTMAAVDGVDTTFFPTDLAADTDGDGLPNFFGTSAAAPHAAGVAALLLQAAGGPGSLSDTAMRTLLQSTAAAHDLDPAHSAATLVDTKNLYTVTLTAAGDSGENTAFDKAFFKLTFTGTPTSQLHKVVIDLAKSGEEFDPTKASGFPFKISKADGTVKPDQVTATTSGGDAEGNHPTKLTLVFTTYAMRSGDTLAFGIDRDLATTHAGGNSADLLAKTKIKARVLDKGAAISLAGALANKVGTGYSPAVGYGLIDAAAALKLLRSESF